MTDVTENPFPDQPAYLRGKVPPRTATLRGAVGDEVSIRWDTWGIPHILASRPDDLRFGLGYATAQECLWRLDYCRRQARGTLAAVLGPDALPSDGLMRRLALGRHADALAGTLDAPLAEALAALAAGINRWIAQAIAEDRLPVEFDWLGYQPEPWSPADTIAIWKYRWWTLTGRLENIVLGEAARTHLEPALLRAFMAAELGEEAIVRALAGDPPPAHIPGGMDTGEGSNNWVVAGSRTTTGHPVLCSDPHNPFGQPGQWFQAQLTLADGSLDVAGAVYAGSPGVYFGRNRTLAWGYTNHVASARDLYRERVDPQRPEGYLDGETWRPFDVEAVSIAVRGAPDHLLEVRRTVRGPLVDDLLSSLTPDGAGGDGAPAPAISLRWSGLEVGSGLDALLALNAADSVDAGLAALSGWPCPIANALLADSTGSIAYHAIGRVPRRTEAARALRDAGDPAHAWQGFIPFDDLPQRRDPPEGWLASANQPPWLADPPGLAYLGSAAWADGWRMRRIREQIEVPHRLTPEAIAAVQGDVVGGRAAELVPQVAALLREASDPAARQAGRLLDGWDGSYALDTVAPAVWTALWEQWLRRVAGARFPSHLVGLVAGQAGAVARSLLLGQDTSPPWFESRTTVAKELQAAGAAAIAWLVERLGQDQSAWRWGTVHTVTWRHPLSQHGPETQRRAASAIFDVGPFPTTGGAGTVRAAGHGATPFRVSGGATYRLVADLAPGGGLRTTTTTGQSGHPGSPHYADQAPLWLGDAYHPFPMDEFEPEGLTRILPGR